MNYLEIKVKKLHPNATLPTYGTDGSACFDLYACEDASSVNGRCVVSTGLAFEIPEGYEMVVRPRSGLAFKRCVWAFPGTIDSDYRGEVAVLLVSEVGVSPMFDVGTGDRIAQVSIQPVLRAVFTETRELSDTARGAGGFGSTGV